MKLTTSADMSCEKVRDALGAYVDDRLEGETFTRFRAHLDGCGDCRAEAERRDGSILFSRLAVSETAEAEGPSRAEAREFLASVKRGIAIEQAARRTAPPERFRLRPSASMLRLAAAASFMTLVGLLALNSGRQATERADPELAASLAPSIDGGHSAKSGPLEVASARSLAPIEDLDRLDARVYQLAAGGADDDPQVVLIVDRGMDI